MTTEAELVRVTYADLPRWGRDAHATALTAFCSSAHLLRDSQWPDACARHRPSSSVLARLVSRACELAREVCGPAPARAFFEDNFIPHHVVHAQPAGLLTGYYEPVLTGSRRPTDVFKVPIYRRPPDLVNLVPESARGTVGAGLTHARRTNVGDMPYATRAEIEAGALAGRELELFYCADPVDVFFMHIQGSGCIELEDGRRVRIAYDGKNGHPYTSVGRHLIETGAMTAEGMTLAALGAWLRADPDRGRRAMQVNKSYVFFRELPGGEAARALGVEGIPLTPGRSLAVDAGIHVIGLPFYVSAPSLTHASGGGGFHRLMIAQDVGSAITGPVRGDIYFGSGEEAGCIAGATRHPGHFYVLLPRREALA
jgi:membrane-bound lytic murein transglycosylase A